MRRIRIGIFAAIYASFTALFAYGYYSRYWLWRDCFNDNGNCWVTEHQTNYTTAGFVWGPMAVIFALLLALALYRLIRASTSH